MLWKNPQHIVKYRLYIHYCMIATNAKLTNRKNLPFVMYGLDHTIKDYKDAISRRRLLEAEFSSSPVCNLDCPFCYTNVHERKDYEFASLNKIDFFLEQVSSLGAKTVRVVGLGEPFLDKRIYDGCRFPFIELAKKHGLITQVYTNGTLIDKNLAKKLSEENVSLVLKMYSFSPSIFEKMTGYKGCYTKEKQVEISPGKYIPIGLQEAISAGLNENCPTKLGINTVITKDNVEEVFSIYQFARERDIAIRFSGVLFGQKTFDDEHVVSDEKRDQIFGQIADYEKKRSGISFKPYGPMLHGGCKRLGFNIIFDGLGFRACCGAKKQLLDKDGNLITLENSTVESIVKTHPVFEAYRNARNNGEKLNCVMVKKNDK